MPFTPEQPFQITEDGRTVATLSVNVDIYVYKPGEHITLRAELALSICDFLNERYPVKKD